MTNRRLTRGYVRLLPVLLWLAGCAQILGADDYAKGSPDTDAAPGDAGAASDAANHELEPDADVGELFDPQPYLAGAACGACLQANCPAPTAACDADDGCRGALEDARKLDPLTEPVFLARDLVLGFTGALLDALRGNITPGILLDRCVGDYCSVECGRSLGCRGRFEWPESFPASTTLSLMFSDWSLPAPLKGWEVRACAPGSVQCDPWLAKATTDDVGLARLTIELSKIPFSQAEFTGYLQTSADGYYPMTLHHSGPFLDGDFNRWLPPNRASLDGSWMTRGIALDPALGQIWVWPVDCAIRPLKGVTVELWRAGHLGFQPCTDCKVWYSDHNNIADFASNDLSTRGQLAYPVNVPPGEYMVVVRDTKSRVPLSFLRSLAVRANHIHALSMYPASASELARFPKQALEAF